MKVAEFRTLAVPDAFALEYVWACPLSVIVWPCGVPVNGGAAAREALTDIPVVLFAVEDFMSLLSATAPPFMEIVPGNVTFCDESYVYIWPVFAIVEGVVQPTPPKPNILFILKPAYELFVEPVSQPKINCMCPY